MQFGNKQTDASYYLGHEGNTREILCRYDVFAAILIYNLKLEQLIMYHFQGITPSRMT